MDGELLLLLKYDRLNNLKCDTTRSCFKNTSGQP